MTRNAMHCPVCGSDDVVEIVYGLPTEELIAEAERGVVSLGGCCITGDDPEWHCRACRSSGPPWPDEPPRE